MQLIDLEKALKFLGQILQDRELTFEIVAIGGGSLLLLGQVIRPTIDLDLVALRKDGSFISAVPLPKALIQAVEEVGRALNLGKDWINIGPASLLELGLPEGFSMRMHSRSYKNLIVHLADRFDQICFKLYATVDQGPRSKHFTDLISLRPSMAELEKAKAWCITHDVSENFRQEIEGAIAKICETVNS